VVIRPLVCEIDPQKLVTRPNRLFIGGFRNIGCEFPGQSEELGTQTRRTSVFTVVDKAPFGGSGGRRSLRSRFKRSELFITKEPRNRRGEWGSTPLLE
jgi:hypothetical protein